MVAKLELIELVSTEASLSDGTPVTLAVLVEMAVLRDADGEIVNAMTGEKLAIDISKNEGGVLKVREISRKQVALGMVSVVKVGDVEQENSDD